VWRALFVDDGAGDYHLRPGSPAIDAGLTLPSVTVDLEGRPRPTGGASDAGAYEISGTAPAGCGDGVLDVGLGEQCDDGNQFDGDCCSATCRAEAAGGACATADVCLGPGSCDGAGSCATSGVPECDAVFPSGLLVVNEAVPGKESVLLKLGRAPAISQADLGDPRAYGGTRYAVCLYDDAETAVARLEVERGGDVCGRTSCWRATGTPPGGRGYRYKDAARDESGILLFSLSGGSAGKPKFLLKGKNDASAGQTGLPTGVAAALAASTTAKVRVFASDVARCWSAELDPLPGSSPALFRAER
jgi:cysteine-rich repeat protein